MKRWTESAFAAARRGAMHEAAGAPPQLTDGACAAAQSTGAAALRPILQARPLALRVHRERAIVANSTDLWAADLHVGRALRKDNRGPRMLGCSPGRGPAVRVDNPEEADPAHPQRGHTQGRHKKGGRFPSVHSSSGLSPAAECRAASYLGCSSWLLSQTNRRSASTWSKNTTPWAGLILAPHLAAPIFWPSKAAAEHSFPPAFFCTHHFLIFSV